MRRTVFPAILMLLFSGPAFAEVPNTFKSGTKAVASEVNENFSYLDKKLTEVADTVAGMKHVPEKPVYEFPPYAQKHAEIGDTIATINEEVFVLGAVPFREYQTGNIYKVIMPMRRQDCNTTTSELREDGTLYIKKTSCKNGRLYYYTNQIQFRHTTYSPKTNMTVSGFPAFFNDSSGEISSIQSTSTNERKNTQSNPSADPPEVTFTYVLQPVIGLFQHKNLPSLTIKVLDTQFTVSYFPDPNGEERGTAISLPENSGPDFSATIPPEKLNSALSIDMIKQYRNLYNYIRIERMDS